MYNEEKNNSFWSSLFDFEFNEFITIRLAGLIYMLAIFLISLFTVIFVIDGFGSSFITGILHLIISPVIFLILVTGTRVWLEITVVVFDIAKNLEDIKSTLHLQSSETGELKENTDEIPIHKE